MCFFFMSCHLNEHVPYSITLKFSKNMEALLGHHLHNAPGKILHVSILKKQGRWDPAALHTESELKSESRIRNKKKHAKGIFFPGPAQ